MRSFHLLLRERLALWANSSATSQYISEWDQKLRGVSPLLLLFKLSELGCFIEESFVIIVAPGSTGSWNSIAVAFCGGLHENGSHRLIGLNA